MRFFDSILHSKDEKAAHQTLPMTPSHLRKRFQQHPDGSHSHHLTMPAPSLLTGLLGEKPWRRHYSKDHQEIRSAVNASPTCFTQSWTCHQVIGRGAFGVVRLAHKKESPHINYAVKEFRPKKSETTADYAKRLTFEFCIGSTLHHHTHVTEILDLMPLDDTSSVFCQVMEYCDGGDLFDLLPHQLETDEANCLFKQLIRGVHFMHSMGIAHRDLKPENLLLTSTGCLKIGDFGSAAYFFKDTILVKSKGVVGSAPYIAPEEFVQQEYDASKVDIWSCGMIYMAMRTGTHLWHVAQQGKDDAYDRYLEFRHLLQDERDKARHHSDTLTHADCISAAKTTIKEKAKEGDYDVLAALEMASKKLVYRLLDPAPEKRILTPDILKNEWFGNIKTCQSD
ncbi:hypothetical protein [Absidia glauca]|uniref:non-specific serine/threonine protein kinase n=1 Tax=Absidia glauca TaxID=4829 RepID=A0A168N8T1_ABSGL|nr:hypothetical protein [Absidia glauca]